jgi:hypothetical protein
MPQSIAALIEAIKTTISLWEVRSSPTATDRLEVVIARRDLDRACELLRDAFGPAAKEFGKPSTLDAAARKVVEQLGGIRQDQCLYLQPSAGAEITYAVLWPWSSDSTRVTLKVGTWKP